MTIMNDALAALAIPRRQEILRIVWDREVAAGEIAAHFDVSFSAISQHLKALRDAGVVVVRRDGKRRLYRVDRAALGTLAGALEQMWATQLAQLKDLAEAEERRRTDDAGS